METVFWMIIIFGVGGGILGGILNAVFAKKLNNKYKNDNTKITTVNAYNTYSTNKVNTNRPKMKYTKVEGIPNEYVVFDIETTGLDFTVNDILEIGAIRYNNGVEVDRFHTYVNIKKPIPDFITNLNGISNKTIKNAPSISSALNSFVSYIGNLSLIAYNSDFDMSFIQYFCQTNLNITVSNPVIDALPLAKKYLSNLPNKKLETIKKHFGLNVGSHNAIDDCIVTNHLYQYCRQFEELKYKYIIRFSYDPFELNEKEVIYLNEIVKICEENGIVRGRLTMSRNSQYLTIESNYYIIARLKLYSKLQYILLNIPYSEFDRSCSTNIKYTPAQKNEMDFTRIFPETPEQLCQLKEFIPTLEIRQKINNN